MIGSQNLLFGAVEAEASSPGGTPTQPAFSHSTPPPYDARPWSYAAPGPNHPQRSANGHSRQSIDDPASDRTPLLPSAPSPTPKTKWDRFPVYMLLIFLLCLAITPAWNYFSSEDALDPAARDRLRRAWDKEIRGHEATRRAWASEVAAHETIRMGWEEERLQLMRDREEWLREKHGEETRRKAEDERVRAGWEKERLRLVRDREEWRREKQREETRREAEDERVRAGWEKERLQLVRDREEWLREKQGEETRRKAEDERVRASFAWESLRAEERCVRHGARQYSARISNVPRAYDPAQACTETAVEIHGRKIANPSWCEKSTIFLPPLHSSHIGHQRGSRPSPGQNSSNGAMKFGKQVGTHGRRAIASALAVRRSCFSPVSRPPSSRRWGGGHQMRSTDTGGPSKISLPSTRLTLAVFHLPVFQVSRWLCLVWAASFGSSSAFPSALNPEVRLRTADFSP
ncbi:hypothetical protein B0H17DRAFT_1325560 [Mycena rosella]|uniref:Uncharacterized protein n=1 Tax=Mycena rosella TaxID=1033263 RepID=A0AAD7M9K5_MYCRO|nr:hypothetical protein B0H17DRAFT_1325560 [Mycena rosella]